jgi:hypothetical protein
MSGNALGINLGGGPFRPNADRAALCGPNDYQSYPVLLDVNRPTGAEVKVAGRLSAVRPLTAYRIDLYSQAGCDQPGGQGLHYLGRQLVRAGLSGSTDFTLTLPAARSGGERYFTATATAPDGSTSEFSPCLGGGHDLSTFTSAGTVIQGVSVVPATGTPTADTAAASRRTRGLLYLFCPPAHGPQLRWHRQADEDRKAELQAQTGPAWDRHVRHPAKTPATQAEDHRHRSRWRDAAAHQDHKIGGPPQAPLTFRGDRLCAVATSDQ